ncbi:MAG: hypothetical protein ACOY5C_07945 [Pseudomonadota bacterium]
MRDALSRCKEQFAKLDGKWFRLLYMATLATAGCPATQIKKAELALGPVRFDTACGPLGTGLAAGGEAGFGDVGVSGKQCDGVEPAQGFLLAERAADDDSRKGTVAGAGDPGGGGGAIIARLGMQGDRSLFLK